MSKGVTHIVIAAYAAYYAFHHKQYSDQQGIKRTERTKR